MNLETLKKVSEEFIFYDVDNIKAEKAFFFGFSILFQTYSIIHYSMVLILLAITTNLRCEGSK